MTIDRLYKVEMTIHLPLDFEFSDECRNATFSHFKNNTTTSDLLLEEIRHKLSELQLTVRSLSVGLSAFRVIDEKTGAVLKDVEYEDNQPQLQYQEDPQTGEPVW